MSKNLKNINIPGYGDIDVAQISTGELAKYNPEQEHKDQLYIASDTNNILYNNQQLGIPTYKATEVFFDRIGHYKIIKIDNLDFDNLPAIFYVKDCIEHYSEVDSHLGDVIVIPIINETGTYAIAIRPTIGYSDSTEIAKWIKCTYSEDDPTPYFSAYSNYSNFGFRKVVTLDNSGKIPSSQLPSYVDDVLEYDTKDSLPETGEYGKIYVTTDDNKTYRWSGSTYIEIGNPLGEEDLKLLSGNRDKWYVGRSTSIPYPIDFNRNGEILGNLALRYAVYRFKDGAFHESVKLSVPEAGIHNDGYVNGLIPAIDKKFIDTIIKCTITHIGRKNLVEDHLAAIYDENTIKIPISNAYYDKEYTNDIFETINPDTTAIRLHLDAATLETAGVMTANDKSKLDSIEVEKLYTSDNLDLSNYVSKTEFDTVKTELDTLKAEFAKFKEDTTTLLNDLYNIVKTN